ncbi:ATP-binding protein, partial [Streptomyces sp. NPDC004726]
MSRRRDRAPLWWPLATLVAIAAAGAAASRYTPADWRQILTGVCAAVAVLALSWLLLLARLGRAQRARYASELRTAEARDAEVTHLASVRVPAIGERLRTGRRLDDVPGPLSTPADLGEEFARSLGAVVEALGSDDAVRRERALRDSVQAAFESVARNMHAMATVQQQVLDRVEQTIEDPRLMAEVMKADHAAAQMTRKAQTLLVMCGIWPARRETRPVSLYDCVRGAQSRIVEFTRVEIHGGQTLYVVPPAVEGLMHAVAELLENATVFSPSRTQVVVTIREVGAGAVVEIDDAGLGMPPDVMQQATARLRDELDLANLGAVPRLGLACVGRWTRELGFSVELTGASAYGGTRAVTFVPYRLLTEPLSHFSADDSGSSVPRQRVSPTGHDWTRSQGGHSAGPSSPGQYTDPYASGPPAAGPYDEGRHGDGRRGEGPRASAVRATDADPDVFEAGARSARSRTPGGYRSSGHDAGTRGTQPRRTPLRGAPPEGTSSHDTGSHNTGSHDTGPHGSGTYGSGTHDASPHDTGSHDSGWHRRAGLPGARWSARTTGPTGTTGTTGGAATDGAYGTTGAYDADAHTPAPYGPAYQAAGGQPGARHRTQLGGEHAGQFGALPNAEHGGTGYQGGARRDAAPAAFSASSSASQRQSAAQHPTAAHQATAQDRPDTRDALPRRR